MTRIVRMAMVGLAAATVLLVPSLLPAGAAGPSIAAGQHFEGVVNGHHANAIVKTVCLHPGTTARTGPVLGKQTIFVRRDAKGQGDTGLFDSIYAWFSPANPRSTPVQLQFKTYDTPKAIPQTVLVPCSGSGTVVFSSCPYRAPCAAGWVAVDVKVTFVNVAG